MYVPRFCIARKPHASTASASVPKSHWSLRLIRARALGRQRHALAEQALVVLERQVGDQRVLAELDAGRDLRRRRRRCRSRPSDLATDTRWWPSRTKYRSPTLNSETGGSASPRRWAALIRSQRERRRAEVGRSPRSKSTRPVDAADDRLERHHLQAEVVLAGPAERLHDLLEREHERDVVGLAAQAAADVREQARPAGAGEVGLSVGAGEPRAHRPRGLTRRR